MGRQGSPIRAVLFDWGGTLMREIPEFDGPMAGWPRVEAVPGAKEALRSLHGRHVLAVATNAVLSDEPLVRKALARAGLDPYFATVVTARDAGATKPDPEFFRAALDRVSCSPWETVMVGDSYFTDMVGAKVAGLRAVWFNPAGSPCPLVHPVHDAEIRVLADLPSILAGTLLPDIRESLRILQDHAVPENVVRHSLAVAAVAHWFALRLRERGVEVDPLLVHRGGLLHDLDKLSSQDRAKHGAKTERILRELGWPDLAAIAERHVLGAHPETWEEKLVHYADKIVEEDRLVGLEARVSALSRRYSSDGDRIARALPQLLALEQEIVGDLPASREKLREEVQALDLSLPPVVTTADPAYDR